MKFYVFRKHKIEPTDEADGASGAKRVKKENDKEEAKAKEELKKQVRAWLESSIIVT